MKVILKPIVHVVRFEADDIITTSPVVVDPNAHNEYNRAPDRANPWN